MIKVDCHLQIAGFLCLESKIFATIKWPENEWKTLTAQVNLPATKFKPSWQINFPQPKTALLTCLHLEDAVTDQSKRRLKITEVQMDADLKVSQVKRLSSLIEYYGDEWSITYAYEKNYRIICAAVNCQHLISCQVLFIDVSIKFATGFCTANLVKPDDCPPSCRSGKAKLIVSSLSWTHNDAFVVLMFETGAIAVVPRLASNFLRFMNPTAQNIGQNDLNTRAHYRKPRFFNEIFTGHGQKHLPMTFQMSSSDDYLMV